MRHLFFFVLAMAANVFAQAQNCGNYLLLQNNKTVEMTVYNKKGREDGKQVWKVSNVHKSGAKTTATINSEFFDKDGTSISKGQSEIMCSAGTFNMSMWLMVNQKSFKNIDISQAKFSGSSLEYPAAVQIGIKLKDGNFKMEYTMGDIKAEMAMDITERIVVGKESITSPAGTWECFKITTSQKITNKIGGIGIPMKIEVTEWFAPGVGIIKTESKFGSTLITAIK